MASALAAHSSFAFSPSSRLKSSVPHPSPAFSPSGHRLLASFPEFRGLKIQMPSPKLSLLSTGARNSRVSRRSGGRVVCEAQETTIDSKFKKNVLGFCDYMISLV